MNRFQPEPQYTHGMQRDRCGILMVNLGTPEAPTAAAVRPYLAEFLSDPRVVEIPAFVWKIILHGIILRVRPAKSAAKYASIWTAEGSPLMVWSRKQASLLRGFLGNAGLDVEVELAMRYGQPSIPDGLKALRARGCDRVLVLPMYPQYSGPTTATVFDAVHAELARWRNPPEIRQIKHFHDDPAYIEALALRVREHWQANGQAERLVLSFHGVPRRTLDLGDPYHCECYKTARLLREALGLSPEQVLVTFQSRFGKAEWLKPYTEPTLKEMARKGVRSVDVFCPGFVVDCLETLEEIAMEAREAFLEAGGERFAYIPALNDQHAFVHALAGLVQRHLAGWPVTYPSTETRLAREQQARVQRAEALSKGASR